MEEWKAAHRRGSWCLYLGIVTEFIQTSNLTVAPVFPPQALSACGEEGLTTIVGWWKMGPLVSF